MNAVEELEEVLTLPQQRELVDFSATPAAGTGRSTQQLLDELLGRFEDDDSPMAVAHVLAPAVYADSDE
jgi:hypothetical protein